jgi:hypothetical protein
MSSEKYELAPRESPKKLTAGEVGEVARSPFDPKEIELAIEAREQADERLKEKGIILIL